MESFTSNPQQSAGTAALDALFVGTPAPAAPSKGQAPSSQEPAPDTSSPGEHGKLGDIPGEPAQAAEPGEEAAPSDAPAPNWMEFQATDNQGKRKVRVDLNDKEALAKILPQAYGFRRMQADRDNLKAELAKVQPRAQELEANWSTLEKTYSEGGIEGLVDLLGGKKGHFKEWRASEIEKEARYAGASEVERKNIELEEKLSRIEREATAREKRVAEETTRSQAAQSEAQLKGLENQLTPAFNKHRLAGSLGDSSKEAFFDQAIWDHSIKQLEKLPDNVELTPALIEREFRAASALVRATIGKQASAQAKSVLDKKKQAAQVQVAAAATRNTRPGTAEQNMATNIRKGGVNGLTDALMDVFRSR